MDEELKAGLTWGLGILVVIVLIVTSCIVFIPGCNRSATSFWAGTAGADWIVVQYGFDGQPFNCWKLQGVSISNEEASDGIYWKNENDHLVHVSGWYNRVQVSGGRFDEAAKLIGVDSKQITNGEYLP